MTFAQAAEKRMKELGMNATQLSDSSGVGKPYLSKLFKGKVIDPTWPKTCRIIDALDMTTDEFRALMESDID